MLTVSHKVTIEKNASENLESAYLLFKFMLIHMRRGKNRLFCELSDSFCLTS